MARERFWRRGVPVVLLLLLLAVPPLAGSAGFVARDVGEARRSRAMTDQVSRDTEGLLLLLDLRIALIDEYNWSLVNRGLDDAGFNADLMNRIIGIDPVFEADRARAAADRALDLADDDGLRSAVTAYRADTPDSLADAISSFDALEAIATDALDDRFDGLRTAAARSRNGGLTLDAIEVLETIGNAQRSMARALTNLFGVRFTSTLSPGVGEIHRLGILSDSLDYEQASSDFDRSTAGADVISVWKDLGSTPAFERYSGAITDVVSGIVRDDSTAPDPFSQLDEMSQLFVDAAAVVVAHRDLLDLAAVDVRSTSGELAESAEAAADSTIRELLVLLALTAVVGLLVTYLIVRPSLSLAAGAEKIERGDTSHRIPVRGPAELRNAARALNGATATLDLVEQQARQMAAGELAATDVTKATPGPLGDSLRSAIEILATSITDREALRSELAYEASHDGLTGLPNRTAILERLDDAVARSDRNGTGLAVMFLDLDGFKSVNDELGHGVGDIVLKTVADRFTTALRQGDAIGRLGGDEFLLVAEPVTDAHESRALAARLVEAASEPISAGMRTATIGVSVGIALGVPGSSSPTELLHAADIAVYAAKADADRSIVVVGEKADDASWLPA